MSGGVDSAVAAALLAGAGWQVGGVTFKLFCYAERGAADKACCGLEGVRDAQATARRLGIPHTVLDLSELFRQAVIDDFVQEYGRGRTPNPCVQCNTHVKFGPLLAWARRNGYDHIATGHYARLVRCSVDGRPCTLIGRASHPDKDQSYVLWGVPAETLEFTLFPLGELSKAEIRARARGMNLPVWDKDESQDICFVDGEGYSAVLREHLGGEHPIFQPGEIRDLEGRWLGSHPGLAQFTVGQRRGLGLGGPQARSVVRLETASNTLWVGSSEQLLCGGFWAHDLNFHVPPAFVSQAPVEVKIRYRHAPVPATVTSADGRMHVRVLEPLCAVAPGQSCVVYREGLVLAGGRIEGACACCSVPGPAAARLPDTPEPPLS